MAYVYIYIYIYIYLYTYVYTYIYIHREREIDVYIYMYRERYRYRYIERDIDPRWPSLPMLSPDCFAWVTSLGIHQRGVQWEGGAVDGGTII